MTTPRLVVVCGLPGSGKTTHAKRVAERLVAVRFSADDCMTAMGVDRWDADVRAIVEAGQRDLVAPLLERRRSVVVEWGSWSVSERETLRRIGLSVSIDVRGELHHTHAPVDELHRRVEARGAEGPSDHAHAAPGVVRALRRSTRRRDWSMG